MAVKIFNVRLQNLYCTYQELSDANPVLLNGETCYVSIPEGTGIVPNEPAVLMKIGDGSTPWNDLPFINSPSSQGDWEQNDETKADYIKNRTHYEEHRTGTVNITIEDGYSNGGTIVDADVARHIYFGGQYLNYQFATMSNSGDAVVKVFVVSGNKAGVTIYREDINVSCYIEVDIDSGLVDFSHGGTDGAIQSVTISGSYDYTHIEKLDEKYLDVSTPDDAIDLLTETGIITPSYAGSNTFYTDNNGVIYTI